MMLKEKSSPLARLKYLYVLPLAAIAVTAFARPEVSEKVEEISAVKVNDLANYMQENVLGDTVNVLQDTAKVSKSNSIGVGTSIGGKISVDNDEMILFEVVEQMPEYPGGMKALYKYLKDKTESSGVKGNAGGSVTVSFTVSETGKVKDVKASQSGQSILIKEAERIVNEMPDWIPGKQRGVPVPVKYSISVRFGDVRYPENKKPLIIVDGKEMSMDAFEKFNKDIIESVSVLKDNAASVGVYGKRGAHGVILVTTRKAGKKYGQGINDFTGIKVTGTNAALDFLAAGTVIDEQGRPKAGVSVVVPNTTVGAVTDVNGHFSLKTPKDGYLWFSFIGYKTVKAAVASDMSIRMEQEVVNLLPETTNRLVRVKGAAPDGDITVHGVKEGEQPLVIVDGKEVLEKDALSKLAVDRIKSFTVLKDKSATSAYGDKAKDGVIIVKMLTDEEYQALHNKK